MGALVRAWRFLGLLTPVFRVSDYSLLLPGVSAPFCLGEVLPVLPRASRVASCRAVRRSFIVPACAFGGSTLVRWRSRARQADIPDHAAAAACALRSVRPQERAARPCEWHHEPAGRIR